MDETWGQEVNELGRDDDTQRQQLGLRLKEARKYLGLTQEEVARSISMSRTALVEIENGQRKVEALELSRLAKIYRQPVSRFVEELDAGASPLPAAIEHLARKAAELSKEDREELARFVDYLRTRAKG